MIVSGEPIAAAEALKSGAHRRDHRRLVYDGRRDLCAQILAGKIPMRPPLDDDTKPLAGSHDRTIFTNAVAAVTKRNRGLQPCFRLPKRSVGAPTFRAGADARIQCLPQTVPVSIRSTKAGPSTTTNTPHNRDHKTIRKVKRAILKFLKHAIPKNWNRLCDRITDNFPRHPR